MAEASTSYRVLAVRLISPSGGPPLTRYVYVRPHSSPEDGLPKDRAVFVAGIPQQLQGTALVDLFGRFGEIERAALHGTRVSAVLLYAAAAGRDKLMRATGKRRAVELQLPEPPEPQGLKGEHWAHHWCDQQLRSAAGSAAEAGLWTGWRATQQWVRCTQHALAVLQKCCEKFISYLNCMPPTPCLQPGWRSTAR